MYCSTRVSKTLILMCVPLFKSLGEWSDVRTGVPDGMSIQHLVRVCKTEYSPKKSTNICAKCILVRDRQTTDVCYNTYKSQKKVGARMSGKTSTASKRKFNDKTYQRIVLDVRMDAFPNKEAVQVAAQKAGQSLTEYIMEAVRLRMERENAASGIPGVVKNLEGDTDPVE